MGTIVFHGATEVVEHPICSFGRLRLDFGRGFYITDIREQAERWAIRQSLDRGKPGLVNVYRLDKEACLREGRCKIFTAYDNEWLEFIVRCRKGYDPAVDYDYIEGGIANDRVIDSINLYLQGFYSKEDTLRRLSYHEPNNQICLLNQTLTDKYLHYDHTEQC